MVQLNTDLQLLKAEIESFDTPCSGFLDHTADEATKLKRLQDIHAALKLGVIHENAVNARQYQHRIMEALDSAIARSSDASGGELASGPIRMSDNMVTGKPPADAPASVNSMGSRHMMMLYTCWRVLKACSATLTLRRWI